jgi:hypothetical protein
MVQRMRQTARKENQKAKLLIWPRATASGVADLLSSKHVGLQDEEFFIELILRFRFEDICRHTGGHQHQTATNGKRDTLNLTFVGQHI